MVLEFEWDPRKAAANRLKHRVSFEEAATAFADFKSITIADPDHSADEDRFLLLGTTVVGRVLVIAHVERDARIRIISARKATRRERTAYEKNES